MKYSEAVKLLEDNPNNVVEAHCNLVDELIVRMSVVKGISRYFHFEVLDGGKVIDESLRAGGFNGNVALDLDWQLVRQPVTWQEAVQAWEEGNNVTVEFDSIGRTTKRAKGSETILLSRTEINEGTWYVED